MNNCHFDRNKHVYRNDAFVELVKDAIRFFNGTPVHDLPPSENFVGSGVYALYYTGKNAFYSRYSEINRLSYDCPIYVGKAVPKGWRQSRVSDAMKNKSNELYSRLKEHSRSILSCENLKITDFSCRFVIFEQDSSDMISSIEASLIKINSPLWNSCLDGFGNHDPGKGRYEQARSDWDVLHSGRIWAERLKGQPNNMNYIIENVNAHLLNLKK
ncbi:MAG: Eco29kI family restriction endonuclease [Shewanella sp.]|uniref:Eco29kI family restriction endonuclease n=1 Tax=Shewanella sp. TaxID=50422 RepID=UPI003F3B9829